MITKEMIKNGFENDLISIENSFEGCISLCCRIGDNAFYFVEAEDENLTVEEYWKSYNLETTINMLYEILKDSSFAEDNGIYESEYDYYVSVLDVF